jgi:chromate transporter
MRPFRPDYARISAKHGKLAWPRRGCRLVLGMPSDSPPATTSPPDLCRTVNETPPPGVIALFFAFAKMSLAGFGGVLPFARRAIVDEHRWMTADEFNETFALCHFLPGPNIVNLSFVFGSRFRGIKGGLAAFAGLVGPPMLVVMGLAVLYTHFGEIDALRRLLAGISSAAVGLLVAAVFRMMMPLIQRRDVAALLLMLAVFAAIGLVRWPLQLVLVVAIPVSLGLTILMQKQRKKVAA